MHGRRSEMCVQCGVLCFLSRNSSRTLRPPPSRSPRSAWIDAIPTEACAQEVSSRFRRKWEHIKKKGLFPRSQGQNVALAVLYGPYSLDSGPLPKPTPGPCTTWSEKFAPADGRDQRARGHGSGDRVEGCTGGGICGVHPLLTHSRGLAIHIYVYLYLYLYIYIKSRFLALSATVVFDAQYKSTVDAV